MLLLGIINTGCSSIPQYDRIAERHNLYTSQIDINGYTLQTYSNQAFLDDSKKKTLHIYIEGDGHTWSRKSPTTNPTPKSPLMLSLLTLDNSPAIYIARPCYIIQNAKCNPIRWTSARYGDDIVDTLSKAYTLVSSDYNSLTLIGHSGGGTLAMLVAPIVKKTTSVVTLAGNLDIHAWTSYHQHKPLWISHNPLDQPPLSKQIRQFHFVGDEDKNVLAKFVKKVAEREQGNFRVFEGINHTCCWYEKWPKILKSIQERNIIPSSKKARSEKLIENDKQSF